MKKNRLAKIIPFSLLPAYWGISGFDRTKAKLEYTFEPSIDRDSLILDEMKKAKLISDDECEMSKLDVCFKYSGITEFFKEVKKLDYLPLTEVEKRRKILDLRLKFDNLSQDDYDFEVACLKLENMLSLKEITQEDHDLKLVRLKTKYGKYVSKEDADEALIELTAKTDEEKQLMRLENEYKNGDMKETIYEKNKASIKKQPWVNVSSVSYDQTKGIDGLIVAADYNEYFINMLRDAGYCGDDAEVFDNWALQTFESVFGENKNNFNWNEKVS